LALFSDNSPTVSWVRKMAAKGSKVADQLLRALALRMRQRHVSPLTPYADLNMLFDEDILS
jgi:hypothetical protein